MVKKFDESMCDPPVLPTGLVSERCVLRQGELSYGQDRLGSDVRGPEFLVVSIQLLRKEYFMTQAIFQSSKSTFFVFSIA